jgi:hypothetical protein
MGNKEKIFLTVFCDCRSRLRRALLQLVHGWRRPGGNQTDGVVLGASAATND